MSVLEPIDDNTRRRMLNNRFVAIVAGMTVLITIFLWQYRHTETQHRLTLRAGTSQGHRYDLALILKDEAARHGMVLDLAPSRGSLEDVDQVAAGTIDLALIGGEVGSIESSVREVATLVDEPLHLFATQEVLESGMVGLKGERVALGATSTGTHHLAMKVVSFLGMQPERDFTALDINADQISQMPAAERPAGVFVLSPLPWKLGAQLVGLGYRLLEIPYANAMSLHDRQISDIVIPSFSYSAVPPVPEAPLHTIATPMVMIANEHVSAAAVERLMEITYSSNFTRRANLPALDPRKVLKLPDFRLHPGTISYLHRDEPLLNGETISDLENLRSFMVSAALSIFLIWRWYRARQSINFETYFDTVSAIERDALEAKIRGTLSTSTVQQLWERLGAIKAEVLEKHAAGSLKGEEQIVSFLTHVSDARNCLANLTLGTSPANPSGEMHTSAQGASAPTGQPEDLRV